MSDNERREAIHSLGYLAGQTARETFNGGLVGAGLAGVGHWTSAALQNKKAIGITAFGKILGIGAAVGAATGLILAMVKSGVKRDGLSAFNHSQVPMCNGIEMTDDNIKLITSDAFGATGGGEYIRKILETKDPQEREMLKADWKKRAERWKEKPLAEMIQSR